MVIGRVAAKAIALGLVAVIIIYFLTVADDAKLREELRDDTERVAIAIQKSDRNALLKVLDLTDQADSVDLLLEYNNDLKGGYFVSVHRIDEDGVTLPDVTGRSYRSMIYSNAPPATLIFEYNRWTARPVLVKCTVRRKDPPDKLANR